MRTSEHLAAAAAHLDKLVRDGQRDLADRPADAAIAAHARDQVCAGLANTLRTVVAGLDEIGGHTAAVRSGAGVVRALAERSSGIGGPAPTQLATDPPATRSARAWTAAATELESAAVQAARSGERRPVTLRAAAADLVVMASAVVFADEDLGRAMLWNDTDDLTTHARAILAPGLATLRRHALAALTVLTADPLPDRYHLAAPIEGIAAVTSLPLLPTALQRAGVLLGRDQALTSRQHRAVAAALARVAHHLRDHTASEPALAGDASGVDAALAGFAQAQLTLADSWLRAGHLWCTQPGSWQAPTQLLAAAQLLADHPEPGFRPGQVRDTARLLPGLAATAARNLTESLTREHWLAAHPGADGVLRWAVLWPDYGAQPFVNTSATADPTQIRRAWQAAGVPVRAWRMTDPRDQDPIVVPRGVHDLARINLAREAVTRAGQELRASVGTIERPTAGPEPVTSLLARDILRDCPAPLFPRQPSQPAPPRKRGRLRPGSPDGGPPGDRNARRGR